jgi:hypothetical protein
MRELHEKIVHLRLTHSTLTWKQIGILTGYHPKHCELIFRNKKFASSGAKLIEQQYLEALEELDDLAASLWPVVTGRGSCTQPPDVIRIDLALNVLDRRLRWSGVGAWARRRNLGGAKPSIPAHWSSEVQSRHDRVIELRLSNPEMTWAEIGQLASFHPTYCSAIFAKERARALSSDTTDESRGKLLEELDEISEALRVRASDTDAAYKKQVKMLLKLLDRKARLLGVDMDIPEPEEIYDPNAPLSPELEERLEGVARFCRLQSAGLLSFLPLGDGTVEGVTAKGKAGGLNFDEGWEDRWRAAGYDPTGM